MIEKIDRGNSMLQQGIVRKMKEQDIGRIVKIENKSFPIPWSKHSFVTELRENEYARYFCLELQGEVIGYMGLWFILEEGHITNVAIAPEYRNQGWGYYLMRTVMKQMYDQGMERITLEVRASNHIARGLYEQLGFVEAGVRKAYYSDNQENAIVMWAELNVVVQFGVEQVDTNK